MHSSCCANLSAGPIPLRVREAEIPIVSDAECIRKINAVTEKIFILPASSFCAGGEEGNDACQVRYGKSFVLWITSRSNCSISGMWLPPMSVSLCIAPNILKKEQCSDNVFNVRVCSGFHVPYVN